MARVYSGGPIQKKKSFSNNAILRAAKKI